MKRLFFLVLITICFTLSLQAQPPVTSTEAQQQKQDSMLLEGAPLPTFFFQKEDSTNFNVNNFDKSKSLVIMFFNPHCPHCQDVTKEIILNISKFENTNFLLLTGDKMGEYLKDFKKAIEFPLPKNMMIGLDIQFMSLKMFAYEGLPQVMIYGTGRKLKKMLTKDVHAQNIWESLEGMPLNPVKKKRKLFRKR